jgi:hypothetical protein
MRQRFDRSVQCAENSSIAVQSGVEPRAIEQSPSQICLSFRKTAKPREHNAEQVERRHVVGLTKEDCLATTLGIIGVAALQRCQRALQDGILLDAHTQRISVPNRDSLKHAIGTASFSPNPHLSFMV